MKKTLTGFLVVSTLTLSVAMQASAADDKIRNHAGYAAPIGMLVGAAVGGPLGAFAATALGAFIDIQTGKNDQLRVSLASSRESQETQKLMHKHQLSRMREQQNEREAEYQVASNNWNRAIYSGFEKTLGYSLQFRTGSCAIETQYLEQLNGLAHLLNTMPHLGVHLAGYTDQLGEESYNQSLSRQRVKRVETYLRSKGIEAGRIHSYAYGETRPLKQSAGLEDNPFERRVTLHIIPSTRDIVSN